MNGATIARRSWVIAVITALALVFALGLALAACGDNQTPESVTTESTGIGESTTVTQGSGANRQGPGAQIVVKDGKLEQTELQVVVGTAVKFVNAESDDSGTKHQFVADDGSFDTGELVPGDTYDVTFQQAKTITFTDKLDPNIKGTIIVS